MSIIMKDQGQRSQLQDRLAAELREKIAKEAGAGKDFDPDTPDLVEDSAYLKSYQKKPSVNGRVVGLIVACAIVAIIIALILLLAK